MNLLFVLAVMMVAAEAAPGLDFGFPSIHSAPIFPAPVIPSPIFPAPTIIKSFSAPVISPPLIKAPIVAPSPFIKTIAPVPVIKHVAPATSYASITHYAVSPVVKLSVTRDQRMTVKRFYNKILPAHHQYVDLNKVLWSKNRYLTKMENVTENGKIYTVMSKETPVSPDLHNLVGVKSRSTVYKKKDVYKRLSIVLAILIVILFIAFIIALAEYIRASKMSKTICVSEECIRSAANLKLSMDLSVNPCDDFYKFTCGRWSNEHPNHGWYPHFSSFETADEKVAISVLEFLKSNMSNKYPLPVRQAKDLYLSCMDTATLDKLGYNGIIKYLHEVKLPVMPNFFNKTAHADFKFDWIKVEVALKKTFAMDNFIGLLVDADIYNRSRNVIYMGTPDSPCPLPSPVKSKNNQKIARRNNVEEKDLEKEKLKAEAYKRMVKEVIKRLSLNISSKVPNDLLVDEAANVIWNITSDLTELADINSTNNDLQFYKFKIDELQSLSDDYVGKNNLSSKVSWRRYVTVMFDNVANVTLDLNSTDYIYVPLEEVNYLPELAAYVSSIPDIYLELYMWWITTYTMILSTTTEMADLVARESEPFVTSTTYRSRSLDCTSLVINFMGVAVSYGIVDKTFTQSIKPKVETMLSDIKSAFIERVKRLKWMDKETKQATLEKTKEMISFIGFPEWLMDKEIIEQYYTNITMRNDTFLENMMAMVKLFTPTQLESLREETERTWKTDPTTVNAYNYFSDNSITVPIAILTQPFYHLGLEVLNYGAIGSILGHELTHGFDNIGRRFDKFGNYKQWWSNATIETFENKTQCFINQYGNFSIPTIEQKVDGQRTLGENLADNGGLHHAYLAYKNVVKKNGEESKLPGFQNFSSKQLFFIAFGSIWCESIDRDSLKFQLENDEHCPSSLRVIGTLQNSHEFAEAFKCPLGSNMNPKRERCRIW
ncbi:hypothetical protein RI129_007204 [Pyrocoelia pectoralis]|uniref:Endothelin-converting enzyme 1 n=1 Tax=Pyrocoelia pectoralis TaxID=417401 RepID=A0AAN7VBX7_9COLE